METLKPISELLDLRYGEDKPAVPLLDNVVIRSLMAHKSERRYQDRPLPTGALETIVAAAQSAATSSNLQTWSVIALQSPEHKAHAATLCGDQEFIRKAPLFLVFCADLARLSAVSQQADLPGEGLDYLEMFIMATIDASLAGQNAAAAAESLGLGICYVGAARNKPRELAVLLDLPPRVFALFGMTVGWPVPDESTTVKPRLPQPEVCHRETYSTTETLRWIAHYDATMHKFYQSQQMGASGDWTRRSAKRVATVEALTGRHILREVLQEHGFGLK
jgi:nitroreductase